MNRPMRYTVVFALLAAMVMPAAGSVTFLDETFEYDHDRPAAGDWLGNVAPGFFPDGWAALRITDDDGVWSATITILTARAINTLCTDIAIDGPSVEFALASARFRGTISDDGQRLTGTIVSDRGAGEGPFELARTPRATDLPDPMAFKGQLTSAFGTLDMTLVFASTPGRNCVGVIDVPAQGLAGLPLTTVHRDGDAISATLEVPNAPAQIDVRLVEDAQRLTGTFKQGQFVMDVDFPREAGYTAPTMKRPQQPKPPYPYTVRDVSVPHPDGHMLAGTLTMPKGPGPFTAAVLITGSGPQDRDETIFAHKPFLVIADYLTRHGIAVLRCDDRGVGKSSGTFENATTEDLATDALAEYQFLATVDGVDPHRVGLIGHSEGGVIAPIVANMTEDVAFIVLLAGTGVPGDELLLVQAELMARAMGAAEPMLASTRAQQERVFELVRGGADEAELQQELRPVVEAQLSMAGLEGDALEQAVDAQMQQVVSPWMRYFITYDPRPALSRVKCPVLALNGTLDLQVFHDQNLPEIEKAVTSGGGDITIKRYEGLNHLFQPAKTGSIGEYGTIETTFDEAVLRDIVAWIQERVGR